MKISNKKTTERVGRPSLRSITVRRSDKHITFSSKSVSDLELHVGMKVNILFEGANMYLCIDTENGCTLFGYMNGQKRTYLAGTFVNIAPIMLDAANATKVASFAVAAVPEKINGCICYKVISTPLRVD